MQVLVQGTNDTDYGSRDPDGLFYSTVILASTDTSVSDIAMVSWGWHSAHLAGFGLESKKVCYSTITNTNLLLHLCITWSWAPCRNRAIRRTPLSCNRASATSCDADLPLSNTQLIQIIQQVIGLRIPRSLPYQVVGSGDTQIVRSSASAPLPQGIVVIYPLASSPRIPPPLFLVLWEYKITLLFYISANKGTAYFTTSRPFLFLL